MSEISESENIGEARCGENITKKVGQDPLCGTEDSEKVIDGHGTLIAAHYNTEDAKLDKRNESRILHLRNFNNWIKSMLIEEYLYRVKKRKKYGEPIKALDLCCGRGGDLPKWINGNISHLVCCDIASLALSNCQERYKEKQNRMKDIFTAEFHEVDLTRSRARSKYNDPSISFDIVSCQFAFHYAFESLSQAECMMKNVSECLGKGGYFIGTIPNAYALIAKQQETNSNGFGNEVYNISFEEETVKSYPLFGGKYNFQLDGVVDCPEFLVYFPVLVKLAERFGLELVTREGFQEFFNHKKEKGGFLLKRMSALESYPPRGGASLYGSKSKDYNAAKKYLEENRRADCVGTLSEAEWEVTSLYMVFAFQKVKSSFDL